MLVMIVRVTKPAAKASSMTMPRYGFIGQPPSHGGPGLVDNDRTGGISHAAGAIRVTELMILSMASPSRLSVRLAISLRTNRIKVLCGSPYVVQAFITDGLPISFTNARSEEH